MSPERLDKIRKSKDYNIIDQKKNDNKKGVEIQQNEKHGSNTVRDPTPALLKSRKGEIADQTDTQTSAIGVSLKHPYHRTERNEAHAVQMIKGLKSDNGNCPNCANYKKILEVMR